MKILITNDDGYHAEGIQTLIDFCKPYGDILVAAPMTDQSGQSHALTLNRPLRAVKLAPSHYMIDGTPTDCVHYAMHELCGEGLPDLIVSGINLGANLGEDVWYSGTVGGAIEGALMNVPSIAVSLVLIDKSEYHFHTLELLFRQHFQKIVKLAQKDPKIVFNINAPSVETSVLPPVQFTSLGSRRYKSTLVKNTDPRGKMYYWIGGEKIDFDCNQGTDSNAIRNQHISISPIKINVTSTETLQGLKWED